MNFPYRFQIDPNFLLRQRLLAHGVLRPTHDMDRGLVVLFFISSAMSTWAAHLVVFTFREQTDRRPYQALIEIWEGARNRTSPTYRALSAIARQTRLPEPDSPLVTDGLEALRLTLAPDAYEAASLSTPRLEECLRRDGSREDIRTCLRG